MTIEITSCAGKICGQVVASTRYRVWPRRIWCFLAVFYLTKPSYKQVDIVRLYGLIDMCGIQIKLP